MFPGFVHVVVCHYLIPFYCQLLFYKYMTYKYLWETISNKDKIMKKFDVQYKRNFFSFWNIWDLKLEIPGCLPPAVNVYFLQTKTFAATIAVRPSTSGNECQNMTTISSSNPVENHVAFISIFFFNSFSWNAVDTQCCISIGMWQVCMLCGAHKSSYHLSPYALPISLAILPVLYLSLCDLFIPSLEAWAFHSLPPILCIPHSPLPSVNHQFVL